MQFHTTQTSAPTPTAQLAPSAEARQYRQAVARHTAAGNWPAVELYLGLARSAEREIRETHAA